MDVFVSLQAKIEQLRDNVGKTPLDLIERADGNSIYAKLEYFNPLSHSVKDRPAVWMIHGAISRGEIRRGDEIFIEASSGNLGVAYGEIGRRLGLGVHIIVPSVCGETTIARIQRTGAFCERSPDGFCPRGERDGARAKAKDAWLTNPGRYKWLNQYSNEDNPRAHEEATGPEIWNQTRGSVTTAVIGTGTGGSIVGISRFLKMSGPEVEIVAVTPEEGHHIHGVRSIDETDSVPIIQENKRLVDRWVEIGDAEAFEATKTLWSMGYPVGTSSGLNHAASRRIAKEEAGRVIVTLFPDSWLNSFKTMQEYLTMGKMVRRDFTRTTIDRC